MKIVRAQNLEYIPASHEDPQDPSALKKVLLQRDDLPQGRIQMINWAQIPIGKSFAPHYHEAMIEVFIIMSGQIKATVGDTDETAAKGDLLIVSEKEVHSFTNISNEVVDYIAMGVVTSEGGKTVNA